VFKLATSVTLSDEFSYFGTEEFRGREKNPDC
jgi:hypothetical protein